MRNTTGTFLFRKFCPIRIVRYLYMQLSAYLDVHGSERIRSLSYVGIDAVLDSLLRIIIESTVVVDILHESSCRLLADTHSCRH